MHHHHYLAIMEMGHLLIHSILTHPEVSSVASLGFFCLLVCIFNILNIWVVVQTLLWYPLFPQTGQR